MRLPPWGLIANLGHSEKLRIQLEPQDSASLCKEAESYVFNQGKCSWAGLSEVAAVRTSNDFIENNTILAPHAGEDIDRTSLGVRILRGLCASPSGRDATEAQLPALFTHVSMLLRNSGGSKGPPCIVFYVVSFSVLWSRHHGCTISIVIYASFDAPAEQWREQRRSMDRILRCFVMRHFWRIPEISNFLREFNQNQ